MSLLALGRNGRSQAGAEASGLDSLIPPSSHIPFLVSRRGVECEFRNVCHELFCVLAIVTCGYNQTTLFTTASYGLRKARIFLREKPAGASVFSRIFSNMEVRGTLYILKDIREYGVKAKSSHHQILPARRVRQQEAQAGDALQRASGGAAPRL